MASIKSRLAAESIEACKRAARKARADPGDGVSFVYLRIFDRLNQTNFDSADCFERYVRRSARFEARRYYLRPQSWWSKESNYGSSKDTPD